jgi:hypothetical protein
MYAKLKTADLETAVAAFMEGAGLTEKGAVAHWYNVAINANQKRAAVSSSLQSAF